LKAIKKYLDIILNMIYGCIIGVANIIPGVSGGTMAVMLNIYDKLIDSFTGIRRHFKQSMKFLIPIVLGAGAGIVLFSYLIKYLITYHPLPTCFFFIGLIIGSLPLVFKKAVSTGFKWYALIPMVVFLASMTALAFVDTSSKGAVMEMNVANWFYFFISATVAAMCMIIPGVSGSMILMVFGVYSTVIGAISGLTKNFAGSCMTLIPVGLGVIVGIVFGAKLIDMCIKKFPQMTYFAIIGLMVGSPLVIFLKFKAEDHKLVQEAVEKGEQFISNFVASPLNITVSVIVFIVGMLIALFFGSDKLKEKLKHKNEQKNKAAER